MLTLKTKKFDDFMLILSRSDVKQGIVTLERNCSDNDMLSALKDGRWLSPELIFRFVTEAYHVEYHKEKLFNSTTYHRLCIDEEGPQLNPEEARPNMETNADEDAHRNKELSDFIQQLQEHIAAIQSLKSGRDSVEKLALVECAVFYPSVYIGKFSDTLGIKDVDKY